MRSSIVLVAVATEVLNSVLYRQCLFLRFFQFACLVFVVLHSCLVLTNQLNKCLCVLFIAVFRARLTQPRTKNQHHTGVFQQICPK